jgi:hypothetical protein
MKKIKCLLLIVLLSCSFLINQINAEANNSNNSNILVNFESKIYGTVKESVTCVPNSLPGATVTALNLNFSGTKIRYSTTSDNNGEYELIVEPGKYIVFAHKGFYRQIYPRPWYSVNLVYGQEINCSFILREIYLINSYNVNFGIKLV